MLSFIFQGFIRCKILNALQNYIFRIISYQLVTKITNQIKLLIYITPGSALVLLTMFHLCCCEFEECIMWGKGRENRVGNVVIYEEGNGVKIDRVGTRL